MLHTSAFSQGRIVINEYMPWSGCNNNSEFIELKNFGPGPMNIGCYIVTNGKYSVTIPTNTVLQPGQFYVIAGQNTLAKNCGNNDSLVHVNLNWATCGCANTNIPSTGDGFFADGGNANEKVVLFDSSLNMIDAVSRFVPASSSVNITTSAAGGCVSRNVHLGQMSIPYEATNSATGINNSFARRVDGDCGWIKTTAISAGAPNKTDSSATSSYEFTTLSASECSGTTGSISIHVTSHNSASLFPMNYTLAFDADSNGVFDATDTYIYGVDNSAPSIDISNLAYGRYRITVSSSAGCNLKNFDFFIFNCYGIVLNATIQKFAFKTADRERRYFDATVQGDGLPLKIALEAEQNGGFIIVNEAVISKTTGNNYTIAAPASTVQRYRLRLQTTGGEVFYSHIVTVPSGTARVQLFPNPTAGTMQLQFMSDQNRQLTLNIIDHTGRIAKRITTTVNRGYNLIAIDAASLPPGVYQLLPEGLTDQPIRFVRN